MQDFDLKIDPSACKRCKACGLYLNQEPALDSHKLADVFWVGLSAVQFGEDEEKQPLAAHTRSGGLIEDVEKTLKHEFSFYRTNIVKCLPLQAGKIRYPLEHEMTKCFPNFEEELAMFHPSVVFLLGKQVATFVLKKFDIKSVTFDESFNYNPILIKDILFIPIHHPSYILVYKRKFITNYISKIRALIRKESRPLAGARVPRVRYLRQN